MDVGIAYLTNGGGAGESPPPPNRPNKPPISGTMPSPLLRTVEAMDSIVPPIPPDPLECAPSKAPTKGIVPKTFCSTVDATDSTALPTVLPLEEAVAVVSLLSAG